MLLCPNHNETMSAPRRCETSARDRLRLHVTISTPRGCDGWLGVEDVPMGVMDGSLPLMDGLMRCLDDRLGVMDVPMRCLDGLMGVMDGWMPSVDVPIHLLDGFGPGKIGPRPPSP